MNTHIGNIELAVKSRDEELYILISDLPKQGAAHEQQLADRDQQISILSKYLSECQQHISNIEQSRSWKITSPLRRLKSSIRGTHHTGAQFIAAETGTQAPEPLLTAEPVPALVPVPAPVPEPAQPEDPDFNLAFYLANNPDIAASGVDPYLHYITYGKKEGRLGKLPDMEILGRLKPLDASRETVLVVGHEGTRTGAPVLTYNLVLALAPKYNVVVLFLGPGPMVQACHDAGATVLALKEKVRLAVNSSTADALIKSITDVVTPKFAISNSVESRAVLSALSKLYIPAISLIHEFSIYVNSLGGIRESALWSGQTVFSSRITLENAYANELHDITSRQFPIIPQGRCVLPADGDAATKAADAQRIRAAMRPEGFPADGMVLVGIGSVHLRKGVDLFLECAAQVHKRMPELACRFVWIGDGYKPSTDSGYSMFLGDQVTRSGLEGLVSFVDEVSDLAAAYEEADLFLLTSRLDPLPNVAIEALSEGLPVVCFDKATGIADTLTEQGLGAYCVADYLDTKDFSDKVIALLESAELREEVIQKGLEISANSFDMARYVLRLEELALQQADRSKQEHEDVDTIVQSGLFNADYYLPPDSGQHAAPIEDTVRTYVRTWASDVDLRKPMPGFHPGIYLEQHGVAVPHADPFADYIRAGQPQGAWNANLITPAEPIQAVPQTLRVALHVHVFYRDLFPEIIQRLSQNETNVDLLISVTDETSKTVILEQLKNYQRGSVDVRIAPNRGRDIGPLLTEFAGKIQAEYDLIGHVHTKRTKHNEHAGRIWYRFLLENLLGSKETRMADIILGRLAHDQATGIIFPDDPNAMGWCKNRSYADNIAPSLDAG